MKAIFTMNPTSLFLLLVLKSFVSASPLQDTRFAKNYLHDDDDDLARKHHHESTKPKPVHPITSLSHGGHHVTNPNFMLPSGYDHHSHIPAHMVDDVHHRPSMSGYHDRPSLSSYHDRPSISGYHDRPPFTMLADRPSHSSLVQSHFSSVLAPMVRNIVSNVLINIAHGVSSGIVTGLTAGRPPPPPSYHGGYSSPYHYRPYLDAHKSIEDVHHPYDTLKSDIEYINDPSYILAQPLSVKDNDKDITDMKPSVRPTMMKVVKAMIKDNRESSSDSLEELQNIST